MGVGEGTTCAEIVELNRQTFLAEERRNIGEVGWREFLERCLADDFVIRRARADVPNQNREQMLAWIEQGQTVERTLMDDETVAWCSGELGVVVCSVDMLRDGAMHRFQNVKVFRKDPGKFWQCIYWQVSESPITPRPA